MTGSVMIAAISGSIKSVLPLLALAEADMVGGVVIVMI